MTETKEVMLFDITDTAISELKSKYINLKINGLDDKKGYELVHAARMEMRGYRLAVDKRRKELTEDAVKHQKMINSEAKRITEKLTEIEDHLHTEEQKREMLLLEIKQAEEKKEAAKRQERIDMMLSVGFLYNGNMFTKHKNVHLALDIFNMPNNEFNERLTSFAQQYDEEVALAKIEAERIASEKAHLEAEREKLAQERKEAEAAKCVLQEKEEALQKSLKEQEEKAERNRLDEIARKELQETAIKAPEKMPIFENKPMLAQEAKEKLIKEVEKDYKVSIKGTFNFSMNYFGSSVEEARQKAVSDLNYTAQAEHFNFNIESTEIEEDFLP